MDREKMIEQLEQELYLKETGYRTSIEVRPGGQQNGITYGPILIEIVVLDHDGQTIAYRYSSDSHDDDWEIGTIEDAVDLAIETDEQIKDSEEMVEQINRLWE